MTDQTNEINFDNIDSDNISQDELNFMVAEMDKAYCKDREQSGLSDAMFFVQSGSATEYAQIALELQELAQKQGLTMPPLMFDIKEVDGEISISCAPNGKTTS